MQKPKCAVLIARRRPDSSLQARCPTARYEPPLYNLCPAAKDRIAPAEEVDLIHHHSPSLRPVMEQPTADQYRLEHREGSRTVFGQAKASRRASLCWKRISRPCRGK